MSTATESSEPSHHDHIAEEHEKYFIFFNLSLALIAITGIELVIIYLPFSIPLIWTVLIILSVFKFLAVIWWFMHLKWDRILCTIFFMMGLGIATGTVTALMFLFETAPGGIPG